MLGAFITCVSSAVVCYIALRKEPHGADGSGGEDTRPNSSVGRWLKMFIVVGSCFSKDGGDDNDGPGRPGDSLESGGGTTSILSHLIPCIIRACWFM